MDGDLFVDPTAVHSQLEHLYGSSGISAHEAARLIRFYVRKLDRLGASISLDKPLRATAIRLFKRFYLAASVETYPPITYFQVALYLGLKIDNQFTSLAKLASISPDITIAPDRLLAREFAISSHVRYRFKFEHAYTAVYGYALDMQQILVREHGLATVDDIEHAHHAARAAIADALVATAIDLIAQPNHIALAALQQVKAPHLDLYLQTRIPEKDARDRLHARISQVAQWMRTHDLDFLSAEQVADLEMRLPNEDAQ